MLLFPLISNMNAVIRGEVNNSNSQVQCWRYYFYADTGVLSFTLITKIIVSARKPSQD